MRRLALVIPAVAIICSPAAICAQAKSAALVGWLRDASGTPVARADINIESLRAWTRTDTAGFFRLRALEPGRVVVGVRRLGYEPQVFDFTLTNAREDTIAVTMQPNARLLEAMQIDAALERRYDALSGFYERRARGSGIFITREEIEQHHSTQLSDALREIPGLIFARGRGGGRGIRFQSAATKRLDCPPQYFIDGRRVAGTDVDDYPSNDIEAVELYSGAAATPAQFGQSASRYTCGTIVIWTRIPGLP